MKEETEDALEKLQTVVGVFRCVRETFKTYRQKLSALASHYSTAKCWDFPSALVFTRFDGFLARVLQLKVSSTSFEVLTCTFTFSHRSVLFDASNNIHYYLFWVDSNI